MEEQKEAKKSKAPSDEELKKTQDLLNKILNNLKTK